VLTTPEWRSIINVSRASLGDLGDVALVCLDASLGPFLYLPNLIETPELPESSLTLDRAGKATTDKEVDIRLSILPEAPLGRRRDAYVRALLPGAFQEPALRDILVAVSLKHPIQEAETTLSKPSLAERVALMMRGIREDKGHSTMIAEDWGEEVPHACRQALCLDQDSSEGHPRTIGAILRPGRVSRQHQMPPR